MGSEAHELSHEAKRLGTPTASNFITITSQLLRPRQRPCKRSIPRACDTYHWQHNSSKPLTPHVDLRFRKHL